MTKIMYFCALLFVINTTSIPLFGMDSSSDEKGSATQQPKIATKPLHSIYTRSGHLQNAGDKTNLENNDQQIYRLCHNPYQFYTEIQEFQKTPNTLNNRLPF